MPDDDKPVHFFDVYRDLAELEKRVVKVEKWIEAEERSRKRAARLNEILEQNSKMSFKKFYEKYPHPEVDAEIKAAVEQVYDEQEKGLL